MLFHATKKAQDLLRLGPRDLVPAPANDPPPLSAWYVNILTIDRRKCLLVMEATTFYSVFIPGVLKADVIDLGGLVRHHLAEVLAADGFSLEDTAVVLGPGPDTFLKTGSKRVLGCMVEQAFMAETLIQHEGGLAAITGLQISLALNKSILMPLKPHLYPREAMRAALGTRLA